MVVSPSFVADCLETTIELGMDLRHLFLKNGGIKLDLVEGLNASPEWVDGLFEIITNLL